MSGFFNFTSILLFMLVGVIHGFLFGITGGIILGAMLETERRRKKEVKSNDC